MKDTTIASVEQEKPIAPINMRDVAEILIHRPMSGWGQPVEEIIRAEAYDAIIASQGNSQTMIHSIDSVFCFMLAHRVLNDLSLIADTLQCWALAYSSKTDTIISSLRYTKNWFKGAEGAVIGLLRIANDIMPFREEQNDFDKNLFDFLGEDQTLTAMGLSPSTNAGNGLLTDNIKKFVYPIWAKAWQKETKDPVGLFLQERKRRIKTLIAKLKAGLEKNAEYRKFVESTEEQAQPNNFLYVFTNEWVNRFLLSAPLDYRLVVSLM